MKLLKQLFFVTAAMLALASPSFADVTVRYTGSTAFRAAAVSAIRDMFTSLTGYAYSGTSFSGSDNHIFRGTITGITGTVTIKCSWSGSNAGIQTLTEGLSRTFMATASDTPAGTAVLTVGGNPSQPVDGESSLSDITMMDTEQSATPYQSPTLENEKVGVLPFVWVSGRGTPAAMTNMTAQLARQLYAAGFHSSSAWTGDDADAPISSSFVTQPAGTTVYAGGRDTGSGTRNVFLTETGIGGVSNVLQLFTQAAVGCTANGTTTLTVTAADQPGLSPNNMVGKAITGTHIPAATTVTAVGATTITISNAATGSGSTTVSIGTTIASGSTAALYYTRTGGNGGHSSGGSLSDMLRVDCSNISDPFNNQFTGGYSSKGCIVAYLGLSDADRAVNGTGSSVNVGTDRGARYMAYEGVSVTGGATFNGTVTSQGVATTSLTFTTDPLAGGVLVGQLMKGKGIAPGTTVAGVALNTITLSKATTNGTTLANNAVGAIQFFPANVRNGKYSMWAYQRVGYLADLANDGDKTAVKDAYVTQLTSSSTDLGATSAIPDDDDMRFQRSAEGGPISQKF